MSSFAHTDRGEERIRSFGRHGGDEKKKGGGGSHMFANGEGDSHDNGDRGNMRGGKKKEKGSQGQRGEGKGNHEF